jgi:uncharacterized protein (DUF4415 family)
MKSNKSNLTRALLTEDGQVLIQKPDGSFAAAEGQTDWARLDAMSDEDIDYSDIPEMTDEMFARAIVRQGLKPIEAKKQITLRIDADVLAWFRAQGAGYQSHINQLLRAYMEAHRNNR